MYFKVFLIVSLFVGQAYAYYNKPAGSFIVAAPSDEMGVSAKGVWFVNPMTMKPSLNLPKLKADQVYEGWVVNKAKGEVFSTGLFRTRKGVDSDNGGMYAGALKLNVPALPGSDFVSNDLKLDSGEYAVVISVEPYPDADPAPSSLKILKADIPKGVKIGQSIQLQEF